MAENKKTELKKYRQKNRYNTKNLMVFLRKR